MLTSEPDFAVLQTLYLTPSLDKTKLNTLTFKVLEFDPSLEAITVGITKRKPAEGLHIGKDEETWGVTLISGYILHNKELK